MEKIAYTVYPPEELMPLEQWMAEFKVGLMAKKFDTRANELMKQWGAANRPADFTSTILKIKVAQY